MKQVYETKALIPIGSALRYFPLTLDKPFLFFSLTLITLKTRQSVLILLYSALDVGELAAPLMLAIPWDQTPFYNCCSQVVRNLQLLYSFLSDNSRYDGMFLMLARIMIKAFKNGRLKSCPWKIHFLNRHLLMQGSTFSFGKKKKHVWPYKDWSHHQEANCTEFFLPRLVGWLYFSYSKRCKSKDILMTKVTDCYNGYLQEYNIC